ncbi:MAG: agmatinase [Syntrophales bacterium]|jgi:agmatinase|nr:agmatinase [Syntrophales bacterium]MCK9390615.1 agmatinase [Syntrophales bacterium]
MNFGGIEPECAAYDGATFAVIPVPYDLTSTYQSGSRQGPAAILAASANMELYDEELQKVTYREGIFTAAPIEVDARGPDRMVGAIRQVVSDVLMDGKIPVLLGGEHSITLGAVQAVQAAFPNLTVLQLDAHADLRESYQGTPYSHACIARRIQELCPLVQAGIRSMSEEEAVFMKEQSIKTFSADFILDEPAWIDKICEHLTGDIYVTIDLDVLDPAFMPSTGTPEPGGVSWHDVLRLIREVSKKCRIRGFDVVELSPIPGHIAPDFLAAKLIYRIMGYLTA